MATVHLQGIGRVPGKPVKDLKPGDKIMWNYGYTSTVLNLFPSDSGKTIVVLIKSNETGKPFNRRMGAERLVAIAE